VLTLDEAHPWVTTKRTVRGARTGSGIDQVMLPKRKWLASATAPKSVTKAPNNTHSMQRIARRLIAEILSSCDRGFSPTEVENPHPCGTRYTDCGAKVSVTALTKFVSP
jgi:hypothetical protein